MIIVLTPSGEPSFLRGLLAEYVQENPDQYDDQRHDITLHQAVGFRCIGSQEGIAIVDQYTEQ
jgi:hypothetical protein